MPFADDCRDLPAAIVDGGGAGEPSLYVEADDADEDGDGARRETVGEIWEAMR